MTEFSFGLVVAGVDFADDDVINAIIEGGVEDASFAVRDGGNVAYFDREGSDFFTVLREAIADIETAMPEARVCGLDAPDFMTASGVAEASGRSRQSVHQHIKGQRGFGFPPPVLWADGERPLWLRSDVSLWSSTVAGRTPEPASPGLRWTGVAGGAFHLARASCSHEGNYFLPAITFLVDRHIALAQLDNEQRKSLAIRLHELADHVAGSVQTSAPVTGSVGVPGPDRSLKAISLGDRT